MGYTKADLLDLDPYGVTILYGVMPSTHKTILQPVKGPLTHEDSDKHLLALSRELAKTIQQDTSFLRRAKEHIEHLLHSDQGMANRDLKEWRDILDNYSMQRLSNFLLSSSERAIRLRQSSPFFAVLTADERARLINGEDINDTGPA